MLNVVNLGNSSEFLEISTKKGLFLRLHVSHKHNIFFENLNKKHKNGQKPNFCAQFGVVFSQKDQNYWT